MTWTSCCSLPALFFLWPMLLLSPTADGRPLFHHLNSRAKRSLAREEVTLSSKTNYLLAIGQNGTVYGSTSLQDQNAVLIRRPIARGIVAIQGVHSERFLAIHSDGRLVSTTNMTNETHFFESAREDGYLLYKSRLYLHKRWYVGLSQRGKPIRGKNRTRHQTQPQRVRNGYLFTPYRAS